MLIDKIVAKSPYDKNDPISCQDAEVFVKTIANNLENWIKVQTGHPTAVCYDPISFGTAFTLYIRCPAAAKQM